MGVLVKHAFDLLLQNRALDAAQHILSFVGNNGCNGGQEQDHS